MVYNFTFPNASLERRSISFNLRSIASSFLLHRLRTCTNAYQYSLAISVWNDLPPLYTYKCKYYFISIAYLRLIVSYCRCVCLKGTCIYISRLLYICAFIIHKKWTCSWSNRTWFKIWQLKQDRPKPNPNLKARSNQVLTVTLVYVLPLPSTLCATLTVVWAMQHWCGVFKWGYTIDGMYESEQFCSQVTTHW